MVNFLGLKTAKIQLFLKCFKILTQLEKSLSLHRQKIVCNNVTRSYIHLHHIIFHALRRISNNSAQRLHILAVS